MAGREPRGQRAADGVAAILLAAGSSRRFGSANKLLACAGGRSLALIAARALWTSRAGQLVVVTGHDAARIKQALTEFGAEDGVRFVHNGAHERGIGTSIAVGITAVGDRCSGALIAQADMPGLAPDLIDRLIDRFEAAAGDRIVYPVGPDGRQGNPVLWPRRLFPELRRLTGDHGGKAVLGAHATEVDEVHNAGVSAFVDIDTPEDLARYNASG